MITGHHRDVSNYWEDVNIFPPTGHEFRVEHVVARRPVQCLRSPRLLWLHAGRLLAGASGKFSSACCSCNPHWGPEWVTPSCHGNNGFKELVIWWMGRGLSGGRCDWGCDVSPNGSRGKDEKDSHTAGGDMCACNCMCVSWNQLPVLWRFLQLNLGKTPDQSSVCMGIWVIHMWEIAWFLCNVHKCECACVPLLTYHHHANPFCNTVLPVNRECCKD